MGTRTLNLGTKPWNRGTLEPWNPSAANRDHRIQRIAEGLQVIAALRHEHDFPLAQFISSRHQHLCQPSKSGGGHAQLAEWIHLVRVEAGGHHQQIWLERA